MNPAAPTHTWRFAHGGALTLDRPRLVAIINVTPDSFSDGGLYMDPHAAAGRAMRAIEEGADALDIGAESTRPGAERITASEQIDRIVPAIRAIRESGISAPISVDTTLSEVAQVSLDAGADAINDVSAGLESDDMFDLAAERSAGLILMHRLTDPTRDSYSHEYQREPVYDHEDGVAGVVRDFFAERAGRAMEAGVMRDAIVLDPGLGFGKTVEQNYELIARSGELLSLGFPLLSGASRKSFIGAASGEKDPARRVAGSIAASVAHLLFGVRLFRVHDVREQAQALGVARRILLAGAGQPEPLSDAGHSR